jgi:hypothetical protein
MRELPLRVWKARRKIVSQNTPGAEKDWLE